MLITTSIVAYIQPLSFVYVDIIYDYMYIPAFHLAPYVYVYVYAVQDARRASAVLTVPPVARAHGEAIMISLTGFCSFP